MTGKPKIAPKFSRHLFFGGFSINNIELRDNSTRIKCMAMLLRPKELQNHELKICMFQNYLVNRLILQKQT